MDSSVEVLEAKRAALIAWWDENPITLEMRRKLEERDKELQQLILTESPDSIKGFVFREQSIGALNGLRAMRLEYEGAIADITRQLESTKYGS